MAARNLLSALWAGLALVACSDPPSAGADDATIVFDARPAPVPPSTADVPRTAPPVADAVLPPLGADAALPPLDAAPSPLPAHCVNGPLDRPIAGCRPPTPPSTGDRAADCVARINQLRAECQCLPPLGRWGGGEACADMHAEYDSSRSPHAGFSERICAESGSGQNECPGWPGTSAVIDGCLQMMWDEGPGENFQRHGHYLNMTSDRFTEVACGFFDGPAGQWAVQNFR